MSYYNLSCDESVGDDSEESEEEEDTPGLWDRTVVHVDVDCFYCQCEEVDGPPEYKERPIAIGQKHIIVTSNYVARRYGVKKLQARDAAYVACPNLLILEGSDLEHYRKHSRRIYLAFRDGFRRLAKEVNVDVQIKKGGMDENFADITELVMKSKKMRQPSNTFVYGEDLSLTSAIVEDQSGAEVIVKHQSGNVPSSHNVHVNHYQSRQGCQERLETAANLCELVRQEIKETTGFTVTIGVSVSRMLAKLASDLKKPNSLNVLYPWRSGSVILPMPLRKIPELGHSTLRLLKTSLEQHHGTEPKFWTCRDLLQVPYHLVRSSLNGIKPTKEATDDHCTMFLDKCRGLDKTMIEDDHGGLTKQVSVEDSFRRDTVRTKEAVWKAMEELFVRLPILLEERQAASPSAHLAHPTTIRLTARIVDRSLKMSRRRPFKTNSKQCSFHGKFYLQSDSPKRRSMLKDVITPLLNTLVLKNAETPDINVTRMNIAATNFQDLTTAADTPSIATFATQGVKLSQSRPSSQKRSLDDDRTACSNVTPGDLGSHFDPAVLAELPPDIAAEVKQMYRSQSQAKNKKKRTIDCFFQRK